VAHIFAEQGLIGRWTCDQPSVHCWVTSWMGDRLWAGKPSQYVTSQLGQLSPLW